MSTATPAQHHDAPRLVYADSLLQSGDERGKFIVEQCRDPTTRLRPERHWAGRLAPVLRGAELGFRRGFVSSATVRFRHRADIELFGSLPEWRTVEHLTWASPGPATWCRFFGPQMELLRSAHGPSPEMLLSAPKPWARLESLTLDLVRAEQLAAIAASALLPRLETLALGWRTDVDASWFRDVNVSRWKHLGLSTLREAYEGLIEVLQGSSLETLRFRECEFRRGTDGRFSKLKVRAGDWLGFPRLGPRELSRGLPQGFFESIEFDGDARMTEDFKREFEPNRRGQRVRHRPTASFRSESEPFAWTVDDEWLWRGRGAVFVSRAGSLDEVRRLEIQPVGAMPSRSGRWIANTEEAQLFRSSAAGELTVTPLPVTPMGVERVSDDGKLVLLHVEDRVELWDLDARQLLSSDDGPLAGRKVSLDLLGGRWVISSSEWDADPPFVRLFGSDATRLEDSSGFSDLVILPGELIVGASQERGLFQWHATTGEVLRRVPGGCRGVMTCADGGVIGCRLGESTFAVFDARTLESRVELRLASWWQDTLLSPDGRHLMTTRSDGRGWELQVFEVTG